MKLFMVHCGYYDHEFFDGIYEGHVNLFVAAANTLEAKRTAQLEPVFISKKMHVDGIHEIETVGNMRVTLVLR